MRVLFITGCWRSGTTLLGDVLGSLPGFVHVGELHHFWGRGLGRNWLCGCGAPFRECSFWRRVIERVEAGYGLPRSTELEGMRKRLRERPGEIQETYAGAMQRLVAALASVVDEATVVDSSKSATQAMALAAAGNAALTVAHVVRDPRATTYSLTSRPKTRADDPRGSSMLQLSPDAAVHLWLRSNLEAERIGALARVYVMLRYEDFVCDPWACAEELAAAADERFEAGPGRDEARSILTSHSLSGNPDRLRRDSRAGIVEDREWERAIDPELRAFVESRTQEMMQRYGYAAGQRDPAMAARR